MKRYERLPKILWVLLILPMISSLIMFSRLPDKIPIHWNINGQIDMYMPKFPGAFLIPAICIIFLLTFIPSIPKERFEKSRNIYFKVAGVLAGLFLFLHFSIISISMGADFIRFDYLIKFAIGILFMLIGNIMPKLKVEEKLLKKSPWMAKAQRHGGVVWFVAGIIFAMLAFIPGIISAVVFLSIVVIISIEPMLYSYLEYKRNNKVA